MQVPTTSEVLARADTPEHIQDLLARTLETHAHWMAGWSAVEEYPRLQGVAESLVTASLALAAHVRAMSVGDPILTILGQIPLEAYDAFVPVRNALFDYVTEVAPVVPPDVLNDLVWYWASTAVKFDGFHCECDGREDGE